MQKPKISILLITVLLISMVPVLGVLAQDTTVLLTPAYQDMNVGETRTVTLRVENVQGLYGYQANLQFDPAVLEVVDADGVTPGIQVELLSSFLQPEMVVSNVADNAAGTIMCTAMQLTPSLPVTGTGDLVAITFQGKVEGLSDVQFVDLNLFDQNGSPIAATLVEAQVDVGGTATPTPTITPTPIESPTPEPSPTPAPSEIGTLLKGVEADPYRNLVYVAVQSDDTVAIVDGTTYSLTAKIPAGGVGPNSLALSEDGSKLFVVNGGSDNVTVLDANDNYAPIGTIEVGHRPFGIAIGGGIAYVTNFDDKTVTMIDVNTMGWLNTVPVGWHPSLPAATSDRAYIPNHSSYTGWRSNDPAAELEYIKRQKATDTGLSIVYSNGDVETILQEYIGFFAVAIDEVNEQVYVTKRDGTAEGLYVLDMADNSLIQFVPMLRPYGVAVSPLLQYVFVVQGDMNEVYVLDASQGFRLVCVLNTDPNNGDIPGMHGGQGIDVNGIDVVVANYAAGTLTTSSQSPPTCYDFPIDVEYIRGWQESGGNHGPLGQPIAPASSYWYSEQQYERGSMHWRQATPGPNSIYVFDMESTQSSGTAWMGRDSGVWQRYDDNWVSGMPLFPAGCPEASWPYGPMFGFGVTWCDEPGVKDTIGKPIGWEYGTIGGDQAFANGTVFWNPASDAYYVLRNDTMRWQYYRAHRRYDAQDIEPNVTGQVKLQGRSQHGGVMLLGDAGMRIASQENGQFGLHYAGQTTLRIHHPGYLDVQATIKADPDVYLDIGEIELLGGDVNGDNRIDILDISYVGYRFSTADAQADLNEDGVIDILDLSLVGANFGQIGPVLWQR
jgi:YVTN family beta-propeller protein